MAFPDLSKVEEIGEIEKSELKSFIILEIGKIIRFLSVNCKFNDVIFSSKNTEKIKLIVGSITKKKTGETPKRN